MMESALVIYAARLFYAVRDAFTQRRQSPFREGHADDRDLQVASFRHRIECREDHLVGKIACHTEEHQRVRTGGRHQATPVVADGTISQATSGLTNRMRSPDTSMRRRM